MPRPTDNRSTADVPPAVPIDAPGVYLTDEVFLYRVVGAAPSEVERVVELEDCYGLDVVRVPVRALRARGLRVVAAAGSA
jgi:hypothetical protein